MAAKRVKERGEASNRRGARTPERPDRPAGAAIRSGGQRQHLSDGAPDAPPVTGGPDGDARRTATPPPSS